MYLSWGLLFCFLAMTSSIDIKEILAGLQLKDTYFWRQPNSLDRVYDRPHNLFLASGLKI
ncbi:MAG: hypothetical protein IPO25_08710 [Saprospiraceae bacterium]|nr:hypothetical protein [Saprospiraceae bacterium]